MDVNGDHIQLAILSIVVGILGGLSSILLTRFTQHLDAIVSGVIR